MRVTKDRKTRTGGKGVYWPRKRDVKLKILAGRPINRVRARP